MFMNTPIDLSKFALPTRESMVGQHPSMWKTLTLRVKEAIKKELQIRTLDQLKAFNQAWSNNIRWGLEKILEEYYSKTSPLLKKRNLDTKMTIPFTMLYAADTLTRRQDPRASALAATLEA